VLPFNPDTPMYTLREMNYQRLRDTGPGGSQCVELDAARTPQFYRLVPMGPTFLPPLRDTRAVSTVARMVTVVIVRIADEAHSRTPSPAVASMVVVMVARTTDGAQRRTSVSTLRRHFV